MKSSAFKICVAVMFGVGVILFAYNRVFLNIFTQSLPPGIYLRKEGAFERGQYALTCLTTKIARYGLDRGYLGKGFCKTGIIPVGKVIKGIPGDKFLVHNNTLVIGGESFPIAQKDSDGRPLDRFIVDGEYVLKAGEYLLLSTYVENSWDSRYWGPVPVEHLLKPLWVVKYGK